MGNMLDDEMWGGLIPMIAGEIGGKEGGASGISDSIQQYLSGDKDFKFDTMFSLADLPDSVVQKIEDRARLFRRSGRASP